MTKLQFYPIEYRSTGDVSPYAISAGAVVVRGGVGAREVLLLVGDAVEGNGKAYHLPKGHVLIDEALEETVRREVLEESGVKIDLFGYIGTLSWDYGQEKSRTIKTIHYYLATFIEDTRVHDAEHDSVSWVPLESAVAAFSGTVTHEDEIIKRAIKLIDELHG